jgi:hypothetical protein
MLTAAWPFFMDFFAPLYIEGPLGRGMNVFLERKPTIKQQTEDGHTFTLYVADTEHEPEAA